MTEEKTVRYCTRCGAAQDAAAKFCSNCGMKMEQGGYDYHTENNTGSQAKSAFESGFNSIMYFLDQSDYIPYESEENLLIGTNVAYYRSKFDEMRTLHQRVNLNWAALFFGVFWMLYRKMYGVAVAAIAATILVSVLGTAGGVVSLALTVCYGLFGNYLYMMTVQKRVGELQQYAEPARSQYIEKYAGVSGTSVLIGLVVVAIGTVPFWLMLGLSFLSFIAAFL